MTHIKTRDSARIFLEQIKMGKPVRKGVVGFYYSPSQRRYIGYTCSSTLEFWYRNSLEKCLEKVGEEQKKYGKT